tara:strand:+ start:415 stop:744 length:330 start_codon:yes stop_codon:yes gene_type:complete
MRIILDLDGTICDEKNFFQRPLAKLKKGARNVINRLKKNGHTVIIYSARSWNEFEITKNWLRKNKIKYDQLVLGKPVGDWWIDDRAINFKNWSKVEDQIFKIKKNRKKS